VAGRVFISYRRADTAQAAGWMFNRLTGHFGRPNVVMDVDPAPYGGNLAHAIDASVATCDALVLLIGPPVADEDASRHPDTPGANSRGPLSGSEKREDDHRNDRTASWVVFSDLPRARPVIKAQAFPPRKNAAPITPTKKPSGQLD
jgi:hypothetical protein